MKRFSISPLPLAGLQKIERKVRGDERGSFARLFCATELAKVGWKNPIIQINHSVTAKKGTVRGLHFQYPPHAEMKLVTCLRGTVWDVAVDLRQGSRTYLSWHAECLSEQNQISLLIPEGFAHGFQTLTDNVELIYLHSEFHNQNSEGRLSYSDPALSIRWPLPVTGVSPRDASPAKSVMQFEGIKL